MTRLSNPKSLTWRPGDYLIVDPLGRIVRVQRTLTSWAAEAYHVRADGSLDRAA